MNLRRQDDPTKLRRSILGALIVLLAFALKFSHLIGDWPFIAGLLIGAGMLSPTFIIDLVKAWRSNAAP